MAGEITTKKVGDLSENTEPVDTDVFLFGASGGDIIKKIKWGNILKKINTGTLKFKSTEISADVSANASKDITVNWNLPSGAQMLGSFVMKISADKVTTSVGFCNFILDSTLRVQSSMAQQITVKVGCLYY